MGTRSPLDRGAHPVGVRTFVTSGRRPLAVEIWYPADDRYAGLDLGVGDVFVLHPSQPERRQAAVRDAELRPGAYPLVVFSHGGFGTRRDATHLCSHLASHGFVVAAPDHAGNTALDQILFLSGEGPAPDIARSLDDRPQDIVAVADWLTKADHEMSPAIGPGQPGLMGHSLGGWTVLAAAQMDERFRTLVTMAPAWGEAPECLEQHVLSYADLTRRLNESAWPDGLATLILAGLEDALVRWPFMLRLHDALPADTCLVGLPGFGHVHFVDDVAAHHDTLRATFQAGVLSPGVDFRSIVDAMGDSAGLAPEAAAQAAVAGLATWCFRTRLQSAEDPRRDRVLAAIGDLGVLADVHD